MSEELQVIFGAGQVGGRFRERFRQPPPDADEAAAATVSWARRDHTAA